MTKLSTPLLSIIVATHNRPRELGRCLRSISESIHCEREVIVIADSCCEKTRGVVSQYLGLGDTYIERIGVPGPARSRNLGLEIARGDFVLIFDDDDQLPGAPYRGFLEKALCNSRAVSYGDVAIVKEDRELGVLLNEPVDYPRLTSCEFEQIYVKNFIVTPAVIFPRIALTGRRQDIFMRSLEDWEYLLNVCSEFEFRPISEVAAIIYKDFVNLGNRRGSTGGARDFNVLLDYMYVYRRWPAPSAEIRYLRENLLSGAGLTISGDFF